MNTISESELLARCLKGNAEAWDELFTRHYAAAGRFVFQLGHNFTREDVEEICQETFLTVIKHLNSFERSCQFQTWLFRIAANKARDYRDKQHAAKRGGGHANIPLHAGNGDGRLPIDPPSRAPAPDAALLKAERFTLVGAAVEQLEIPCREVIELRYFGDLSYEEIAAALALNPKTVSSRLSKCLDKLEVIVQGLLGPEIREKTSAGPV
ncbi:MAG TPA: sigma-70 family RNA polymerase sigma factor [Candidatus Binatia bacterium]|nr:sigma-70 family RNA polymerase sigma factor [Candidatus Binatia bacterium]